MDTTANRADRERSFAAALLDSHWFYAVAAMAVTCGPLLIPGVGIREWFLLLVGGGVLVYALVLIGGIIVTAAGSRRRTSRPAGVHGFNPDGTGSTGQ